jgi:hypothetical protein
MNYTNQKIHQEHKECAGKACSNPGIYLLRVLYLGKCGWFCSSCAKNLRGDGLIFESGEISD